MDGALIFQDLHASGQLGELRREIGHAGASLGAGLSHGGWSSARTLAALAVCAVLGIGCRGKPLGACNPDPPVGVLGTVCGFANPEDVEGVPQARLVLVSEMRVGHEGGALAALVPGGAPVVRRLWPGGREPGDVRSGPVVGDPACTTPPGEGVFSPHGIASAPGEVAGVVRVAVVDHQPAREAIELFDLHGAGEGASLTWRGCVPMLPATVGNDLAIAPDGEIVVANFAPAMHGLAFVFSQIKGGLGRATGDVMGWDRENGWRHVPGTEAPLPNGVAVSRDGGIIFYSESGAKEIARVSRAGGSPARTAVRGNPDNLAWSSRGTLLVGSHTDGPALLTCVLGRRPCPTGWSLLEIDPRTLIVTELLHHDGSVIGAVASATEIDGRFYLGSVFGDRIGVWKAPGATSTPASGG
jgi:hypothetical protein